MLLEEVENFEKWVHAMKFKIMRPNTMNKYGAVLDDFGLEAMLNQFMEQFVAPISRVFYPEVGGGTLDSHHAFVVEYGKDRDVELGFHVDDSEVTLNVCLGKQFSGGELYFRGIRCENHVNSETQHEVCCDLLLKLPQPSEYVFVSILSAVHVRHALLMDFEYVPLTQLFFYLYSGVRHWLTMV